MRILPTILSCVLLPMMLYGGAAKNTNVLFLVVDDMRNEIGCYGVEAMHTPNMDAFAADPDTVTFERAYVQQAICNPSRTSFLTSRRPDTTRVYDLVHYWRNVGGNFTTIPEHFKLSGYTTAGAGKVFHPLGQSGHLDDEPYSWSPQFPYFHASSESNQKYANFSHCFYNITDVSDDQLPDGEITQHTLSTLATVMQHDDKPWFVANGLHRPHLPFDSPSKYWSYYSLQDTELAPYPHKPENWGAAEYFAWDPESGPRHMGDVAAMNISLPYGEIPLEYGRQMKLAYRASVSFVDALMGSILEAVKEAGQWDDTTIIIIGDHGWQLSEHAEYGKKTNFEEAVRAPMLFKPAKNSAAYKLAREQQAKSKGITIEELSNAEAVERYSRGLGRTIQVRASNALVEFVDILPTLSQLAGIAVPPLCPDDSRDVDLCTEGFSLVPLLVNPNATFRTAAFSQYPRCMHDIDYPGYNGCQEPNDPHFMGYTMRTDKFRFTQWLSFDYNTTTPNWDDIRAEELYVHATPPPSGMTAEDRNLVFDPAYQDVLPQLRTQLRAGWRKATV